MIRQFIYFYSKNISVNYNFRAKIKYLIFIEVTSSILFICSMWLCVLNMCVCVFASVLANTCTRREYRLILLYYKVYSILLYYSVLGFLRYNPLWSWKIIFQLGFMTRNHPGFTGLFWQHSWYHWLTYPTFIWILGLQSQVFLHALYLVNCISDQNLQFFCHWFDIINMDFLHWYTSYRPIHT